MKLGGSVITFKGRTPPMVNERAVRRIVEEIVPYSERLVVVLGGGAHGHQAAKEYGYDNPETPRAQLLRGVPAIRHNMTVLATEVEACFRNAGLPAVVVTPFSSTILTERQIVEFPLRIIQMAMDASLLVITHGDVCFDTVYGASILSGDTIVTHLAHMLHARRVLLGTDVDGIYDCNPKTCPDAQHIPLIDLPHRGGWEFQAGPSASPDVTGGMGNKVRAVIEASKYVEEIVVFNLCVPGRLRQLLAHKETVCTRIVRGGRVGSQV